MKKWTTQKLNKERAFAISERYDLPMLVAMLLDIRGVTEEKDIMDFLFSDAISSNPFDLKDMDKAVARILDAVENNERICVYGDFDADGVTSTALLYSYLDDVGADAMYYIPSRDTEGYGLNADAVSKLYDFGVKLIVTVDNGVAAVDEVAYAKTLGVDVVITDHHAVPDVLPDAVAVVDPHRPDDESRFKDLCGVGVAFKLVWAIEGGYADVNSLLENYSDLVALGTIGDLVPLRGENRVFAKTGLVHINNLDRTGIAAVCDEAGLSNRRITAGNVSFNIVPRINAVGRLSHSKKSVQMLLTDDEDYAAEIAAELGEDNAERQRIEKDILRDIDAMIQRNPSIVQSRVIVVCGEDWHKGVIGIVASRLKEVYSKPSIVITLDGGVCRASGRSVPGFSLIDAVFSCSDLLVRCGGHPMAVGFSIEPRHIDAFIERLSAYTAAHPVPAPSLELDCKLNPGQLSVSLASDLSVLEPYGAGNSTPLFGLFNMTLKSVTEVGGGKHLRLSVARGDSVITAMKFSTTAAEFPYVVGDCVDLAVTLDVNTYNNTESLSVFIREMRFSGIDEDALISSKELFESFCRGEDLSRSEAESLIPTREDFAVVYRFLRAIGGYRFGFENLLFRLNAPMSYGKLRVVLEAMNELSLIRIFEGMVECVIEVEEVQGKVSLTDSVIIKKLKEAAQ